MLTVRCREEEESRDKNQREVQNDLVTPCLFGSPSAVEEHGQLRDTIASKRQGYALLLQQQAPYNSNSTHCHAPHYPGELLPHGEEEGVRSSCKEGEGRDQSTMKVPWDCFHQHRARAGKCSCEGWEAGLS